MTSVRYRENQRYIVRGLSYDKERRAFMVDLEEGETKTVSFNFDDILATGETITSAVVSESSGVTAAILLASNIATLTLSGLGTCGDVELTITRSGGDVFKVYLEAEAVLNRRKDRHYYWRYA